MNIDDERREQLYAAIAEAHGAENADTLFAMLPTPDTQPATRQDIDRLEAAIAGLRAEMDQRFAAVDERLLRLEERVTTLEAGQHALAERIGTLEASQHALAERIGTLEAGQHALADGQHALAERISTLEAGQRTLADGQQALMEHQRALDHRLGELEERFDLKLESMGHQLVGSFRGELVRTVVASIITTVVAIGGLAVAVAQLL